MEEIIKGWGVPDSLVGDYEYKFDGKSIAIKDRLFRMDNGYTFCLVDLSNGKEVAIIDFFITSPTISEKSVRIEIMYVPYEEYRNKGVATFMVEKIKQYAISQNVKIMRMTVAPNAKIFKSSKKLKGPSKEELISFYKSFEDENFEVKVINEH